MSPNLKKQKSLTKHKTAGFTLVEIIVGIVISGSAIAMLATLILPLFARSVEPIFYIRSAEFAQALIDDALAKPFDELTPQGGTPACTICTPVASLGAETADGEIARNNFDDFDDYNLFCDAAYPVQDIFGTNLNLTNDYANYTFTACVVYDGGYDGGAADTVVSQAKRLDVTVNPPPPALPVSFSAYRANY